MDLNTVKFNAIQGVVIAAGAGALLWSALAGLIFALV